MDIVFDLIEAILEIYCAFFIENASSKSISKGKRIFLKLACAFVCIVILTGLIIGVLLIINGERTERIAGIVLLILSVLGIFVHIILGVVNSKKKNKIAKSLGKEDFENKID